MSDLVTSPKTLEWIDTPDDLPSGQYWGRCAIDPLRGITIGTFNYDKDDGWQDARPEMIGAVRIPMQCGGDRYIPVRMPGYG